MGGGHVHSFWDRKLNFCMDIGLDLYFHNLKKKLRYPPSGPPQGGRNPQIHLQNWGGGHAPPNWARKLIFGMDTGLDLYYHNLKDFWDGSTLDPPGGETPRTTPETPQQKVGGGGTSTLFEIGSWFLAWTKVNTYIFIIWKNFWGGATLDPPRGGNHPKNWKNMFWVMWHINRKPMKSSIQICQLNAHLTTHLTVSSWKWPENRFFITVLFRGACPHRMR